MNRKTSLIVKVGLFAALIAIVTAYVFRIPNGYGGYIHLGDVLIYICAILLPTKHAIFAAAIGGGLADLLASAPMYIIPTIIIKSLLVLCFTNKGEKILNKRNLIAPIICIFITSIGYTIANIILTGSFTVAIVVIILDCIQPIASGIIFYIIAFALDKLKIKKKMNF